MQAIPYTAVRITGGFWQQKQQLVRHVTASAVYRRFVDTHRFAALRCDWQPGQPDCPHIFWDSDIAKWLEGVAYLLAQQDEPDLRAKAEAAIADILAGADEDGYFNSHFLVTRKDERFTHRGDHELYCAGHLIEAAVAWREATGEDAFLKAMCRYADTIERVFKIERSAPYATPGHPELELALVRLWQATGEARYLSLAEYFIDVHGDNEKDGADYYMDWATPLYNQDEMPLHQRSTAEGHCVRALYLLCAAADVAALRGDTALADACRRCFDNVVLRRMYITGGVGSTHIGEAFTLDYDLPNRTAYAETCAAISLAMFSRRMQALAPDAAFADTVERVMYNGALSGLSLDGRSFFYENPLSVDPAFNHANPSTAAKAHWPITQRVEVFKCSCCPPNILRFITSLGGMLYSLREDVVYLDQYADSTLCFGDIQLRQTTAYPADGTVKVTNTGAPRRLALRIPGWCADFTLDVPYTLQNGYAVTDRPLAAGETLTLALQMPVVAMAAAGEVHDDAGRVALMRGPVVYCMESVDNDGDVAGVRLPVEGPFALETPAGFADGCAPALPAIRVEAVRPAPGQPLYHPAAAGVWQPCTARFIPYHAFANRGEAQMQVWTLRR